LATDPFRFGGADGGVVSEVGGWMKPLAVAVPLTLPAASRAKIARRIS
jgi:hypothetical protein